MLYDKILNPFGGIMNKKKSNANIVEGLQQACNRTFGCSLEEATEKQAYKTVCSYVGELLAE